MNASLEHNNKNDNDGIGCADPSDYKDYGCDFHYVKNLPPEEVHRRALSARKLWGKAEKFLVSWVLEINDRKLYQNFACSSIYHYASRFLNLAGHTVAEFLRSGRKLADLPILSSAYEKGELSSTHIREVTRVATPDTEQFWYETAKNCTTRKIEKLVAFSQKGGLPPTTGDEQAPVSPTWEAVERILPHSSLSLYPESTCDNPGSGNTQESGGMSKVISMLQCRPVPLTDRTPPETVIEANVKYHEKFTVELTMEEMAVLKDAFDKARKESVKRDRASLLVHMARQFLMGPAPIETKKKNRKPPYQVVYHHHLPSGLSWCTTEKGERPITAEVLEKALCDAEIKYANENSGNETTTLDNNEEDPLRDDVHTRKSITSRNEFADRFCSERMQEASREIAMGNSHQDQEIGMQFVTELYGKMKQAKTHSYPGSKRSSRRAHKTIPPAVRRKVLERDGHCCQTPGCGRELFTVIHHIEPVALGGTDDPHKLITLCWNCHDLVHQGTLTVKGEAPANLVWSETKIL
jgi:hypothetical protein